MLYSQNNERFVTVIYYSRTFGLALIWLLVAAYLLVKEEKVLEREMHSVPSTSTLRLQIPYDNHRHSVRFIVEGYFTDDVDRNSTETCGECLELNFLGEFLEFLVRNCPLLIIINYITLFSAK